MKSIQDILADLRQGTGIKGCAVVTPDGLTVAHSLEARFRDDVVAGLTSFLVMTTTRCLNDGGMGTLSGMTMQATNGKVVFADLETAWLVVLLDQFADLEACRHEIRGATQALRRQARIR